MILSMTGFGRAERPFEGKTVTVEVRSLNGKLVDIRLKSSVHLGQYELELRKLVQDHAVRGKIDLTLDVKGMDATLLGTPNKEAIKQYYADLKDVADDLGVADDTIFQSILKLPNIFQTENGELSPGLWDAFVDAANGALAKLRQFRETEGKSIHDDMRTSILEILKLLGEVAPHEEEREIVLKKRLMDKVHEMDNDAGVDENRFEQEVLYYLDKLDINEEKVRLEQHCKYFLEELDTPAEVKGKKLNFISQEIGREINTLGAKAQWSPIQRVVVQMKNELEKVKEQLPNVL